MEMLDTLDNWCSNNHPIATGIAILIGIFILSFTCKTAWGAWVKRNEK